MHPGPVTAPPAPGPAASPASSVEGLVRAHQRGLWRYLRLLGCREDQVEDLIQETFLQVLRRGIVEVNPRATARYLRGVARHAFLHQLRADRRRERREARARADAVDRVWEQECRDDSDAWIAALRACVDGLPPRTRRALDLTYRDGLGRAATARALALEENGAKTLLQRARARLRDCVNRRMAT